MDIEHGMSYRAASMKYNIPKTTIADHVKHPNIASRTGPKQMLLKIENDLLVQWINKCTQRGYPRTRSHIMEAAHMLLKKNIQTPIYH